MQPRGSSNQQPDLAHLGSKLKALSSPNRLRLISNLQKPRTVDDIHLTPADSAASEGDETEGRQLTRQGVRHHLSLLESEDLIRSTTRPNDSGRDRRAYVVNEPAVFGLLEELRNRLAPGAEEQLGPFKTETTGSSGELAWHEGPKLVLLQGAENNRVFHLRKIDPDPASGRGWVIGRSPEAQIPLQYDPYLSAQNTEILQEDGGYRLVDLRISTNGTQVNGERLKPGKEIDLEHGDIVRVGCSALVFHET